jgi:hypothetical protein
VGLGPRAGDLGLDARAAREPEAHRRGETVTVRAQRKRSL